MRDLQSSLIRERLLRCGVAPRHVRRTVDELESHFADIVAELEAAGVSRAESESQASVRLGSADVIVASVLARPELLSWGRRWPWLAFGLLPVIAFATLFVLSIIALVEALEFGQHFPRWMSASPAGLHWLTAALAGIAIWVTPLLAAGLTCVQAARCRTSIGWPLSATVVISVLGALTTVKLDWPTSVTHGVLSAGLGFSTESLPITLIHAVGSIAVILIPFLWWHSMRKPAKADLPALKL